jgi:NADPH:quinone reductase-like Zn-dependent oxidoreductase
VTAAAVRTFAEVCVVQAAPAFGALAAIPDELPSHVAAALPTAGMTALGALDHTQVPEDGTLLVIGATGGVGTFAVQAASARGIRVIATASAQLAEQVRKLGARTVVGLGLPNGSLGWTLAVTRMVEVVDVASVSPGWWVTGLLGCCAPPIPRAQ